MARVMIKDLPIDQIICGDCLEVMKEWPDNSVDFVITDPPYGLNIRGGVSIKDKAQARQMFDGGWDKERVSKEYIQEVLRISKNQIIFGANYYADILPPSRGWIVWYKKDGIPFNGTLSEAELAWTSNSSPLRVYNCTQHGFIRDSKEERINHPTQKPLNLFLWITREYTKPDDIIFDPFVGSGTTCVAAAQLDRHYIGIDISPKYCELARNRIKQAQAQQRMFTGVV